jgi:hypothetical protein
VPDALNVRFIRDFVRWRSIDIGIPAANPETEPVIGDSEQGQRQRTGSAAGGSGS